MVRRTRSGRLIPLIIVQLWDAELAAAEVRRNAARGVRAICFSEIPPYLGLPVHPRRGYWDPLFQACAETGTVVNMHIGSSSKMPSTSADAPAAVGSTLTFNNAMASMIDFLFSGVLRPVPHPEARLLARARSAGSPTSSSGPTRSGRRTGAGAAFGDKVPEPPSTYYFRQIYGCFFDDDYGLRQPREGRRGQRLLRDGLPALGQHLAPLQGGGASS